MQPQHSVGPTWRPFRVTADDPEYYDTLQYFFPPPLRSEGWLRQLVTTAFLDAQAAQVGVARDPLKGHVAFDSNGCGGFVAGGISVTIEAIRLETKGAILTKLSRPITRSRSRPRTARDRREAVRSAPACCR